MQVLAVFASAVTFGCFIFVLIKLFQAKGAIHGIIGLICALYPFIWGWQNVNHLNLKWVMWGWSFCLIFSLLLNWLAISSMSFGP
jgi:hypothetical protein